MTHLLRSLLVVAVTTASLPTARGDNRVAPVRPSQSKYFGTIVSDPYQWMEKVDDANFLSWLAAQDRRARTVLAGLPRNRAFRRRVEQLSGPTVQIKNLTRPAAH